VVNDLFAKLFSSRRHTLVMYVIIHINVYVLGDRKEEICFGGNRKELCVLGVRVNEEYVISFFSNGVSLIGSLTYRE
jgi:hypothetical protein